MLGTPVLSVIENRCPEANTGMAFRNLAFRNLDKPQARPYTLLMNGLFVLIIVVVALWAGSAALTMLRFVVVFVSRTARSAL